MAFSNGLRVDFSAGEVSPRMHGRADLDLTRGAFERIENFIVRPEGPVDYRPGTKYAHHTRRNKIAKLINFQFNDTQAYVIEATDQYFRFYRDEGIIVEDAVTITAATQANPCVVTTSGAHGYTTGDEVFINDVAGMTELNTKSYVVTVLSSTTFSLASADGQGTAVDSTGFTAYSSGGETTKIYEIKTPYREQDLFQLQFTQNADTMYIATRVIEPRTLVRNGDTNWDLSRINRTSDPFRPAINVTNITQANPGVVTTAGSLTVGISAGDILYISGVVGMTEVNDTYFIADSVTGNTSTGFTFNLTDLDGANVNTSGYSAYSSGGNIEVYKSGEYPGAVTFTDDARLLYGGTGAKPETIWASRTPNSTTGDTRYDDFTTGSSASNAIIFTLAPIQGKVDSILWLGNSDKFILAGTFGSVRRIYGATEQEPIAPDSLTAKSVNIYGVKQTKPVSNGTTVFYIQQAGKRLRSFEYDYLIDGYTSTDRNLVAEHLTRSPLKELASQLASPDVLWAVREDGELLGLTYNDKENKSGWHRHRLGGSGKVLSVTSITRGSDYDQLWLTVERTINGITARHVEYLSDNPSFIPRERFYTNEDSADSDRTNEINANYEIQKNAVYLDAAASYNGAATGTAASASVTPGAGSTTAGTTGVTFTASTSVFTSAMVGREIWKKYSETGAGGGRAVITAYTSGTSVDCTILSAFDDTAAISAGSWFLTATTVSGLHHLEGESVFVLADGAPFPSADTSFTVTDGSITLTAPASMIHVGYKYKGVLKTLPIDQGGQSGPAISKLKNLHRFAMHLLYTGGISLGTSLYRLEKVTFREPGDRMDRPVPAFRGIKWVGNQDRNEREKKAVVVQDSPLPASILAMDLFTETSDE